MKSRYRIGSHNRHQQGFTLIVALIFLVVITLLVVSAVTVGNLGIRIAANAQAKQQARLIGQAVIDKMISNETDTTDGITSGRAFFASPITAETEYTSDGSTEYTTTLYPPFCYDAKVNTTGGGSDIGVGNQDAKYDTYWNIKVKVVDSVTGACSEVNQGVRVLLKAGSAGPTAVCPAGGENPSTSRC